MPEAFTGTRLYMEFWDVPVENEERWLDYYDRVIIESLRHVDRYAGSMVYKQTRYGDDPVRVIGTHWGIRHLGIRTNFQVNLGALLQHEYTHMVLLFMHELNPAIMPEFFEGFKKVARDWKQRYPDWRDAPGAEWLDAPYLVDYFKQDPARREDTNRIVDLMSRDFFALSNNHWDLSFDLVHSRFPIDRLEPSPATPPI